MQRMTKTSCKRLITASRWRSVWMMILGVLGLIVITPTQVAAQSLPDLFIGSILVTPTVGPPGGPVDITFELRNGGTANAGPFNVGVYFSTSAILDPAQAILLQSVAVIGLASGDTLVQRVTVSIPSNAAINTTAYLGVWVDSGQTVQESNESNNSTTATFHIKPGPDLTVKAIEVSNSSPVPGAYITITYTLENIGRADVTPFWTDVYFSSDALIDAQDVLLDSVQLQVLSAGTSQKVSRSIRIPPTAQTNQNYYLGVFVDARENCVEEDESNNINTLLIQVVPPPVQPEPDYIITSFTLHENSKAIGELVYYDLTIRNQGSANGTAYVYLYYALDDRFLTSTSLLLRNNTSIQAGETLTFTKQSFRVPWQAPYHNAPAHYFVRAQINGSGETITDNNRSQTTKFQALPGFSNVRFDSVSYAPLPCNFAIDANNRVVRPNSASGTINLYNSGYALSVPMHVGIYASQDTVLTTGDILLATIAVPAIDPQASYAKHFQFTYQTPIPQGYYSLGAIADIYGVLKDDYGTANRTVWIRSERLLFGQQLPDLTVEQITVTPDKQSMAGGTIKVDAWIRNLQSQTINPHCYQSYRYIQIGFWEDAQLTRYRWGTTIREADTTSFQVTGSFTIPTDITNIQGYIGAIVDTAELHTESNETNNSKAVPYKLMAQHYDFSITQAKLTAEELVWEKPAAIELNIANNGALQQSFGVQVCAWFSYDKTYEPQDASLGTAMIYSTNNPNLQGKISFTPQRWQPGDGYILLKVNCNSTYIESDDNNNWFIVPVKLRKFDVDFVVKQISAVPLDIRPGVTTTIKVDVENLGKDKHIQKIAVCIYFSNDAVFDTRDQLLMCQLTTDIYENVGTATLSLVGLRSYIAGQRYIIAEIDTGRYNSGNWWYAWPTYEETNESNNTSAMPITVVNDVDLTVGSLSVSKTMAQVGENLTFRFEVKNVGSIPTNTAFTIAVVFSDDPIIDKNDSLIQTIRIPELDANTTSSDFTVSYAIPATQLPGERYFGIIVDTLDEVKESNEQNNTGSVKINVLVPGIDLQVRSASLDPQVVSAGKAEKVKITSEFQNFGTVTSPAFEIGFYLSSDDKLDPNDTLLGSRRYEKPLPSTASTGAFEDIVSLNLPANAKAYILVAVDPNNQVRETIETNNVVALAVKIVNQDPRITSQPVTQAEVNQAYMYDAVGYDPDNDPLTWRLLQAPDGMAVDAKTGQVTWKPLPNQGGKTFDVQLEVSDGRGGVAIQKFQVAVKSVNNPPKIVSTPPKRALAGQTFTYTARAIDPDIKDELTWTLTKSPSGMQIDVKSGDITWLVPVNLAGQTVAVEIQVADLARAHDTQSFTLQIDKQNHAPVITSQAPTKGYAGQEYRYQVQAHDADVGDILTWSRIAGPTGLQIEPRLGTVIWAIPAGIQGQQAQVTIRVSDQVGAFAEQSWTIQIATFNRPPVITSKPTTVALLGQMWSYTPTATDDDVGDTLLWALPQSPSGAVFDAATGKVSWLPQTGYLGQKVTFALQVYDKLKASDTQTFEVLVKMRCAVDSDCAGDQICIAEICEDPNCFRDKCTDKQKPICTADATCQSDPCANISCDAVKFCREGKCVAVCVGVTCPSGQSCVDGECIVDPCAGKHCDPNTRCEGGQCVYDPCVNGLCRYGRVCENGRCVPDICAYIQCPDKLHQCVSGQCVQTKSCRLDTECAGTLICVNGRCTDPGCLLTERACTDPSICWQQKCQTSPCDGKKCASGQFCREGACVAVCAGVTCSSGQICRDGVCEADPCTGVSCKAGEVCIQGQCAQDRCIAGRSCKHGRICWQNSCHDDLCRYIRCPDATQRCERGQCLDAPACSFDSECPDTQLCVQGHCKVTSCDLLRPCKEGDLCRDGRCVANACHQHSCNAAQVCRAGVCEESCAGVYCKPEEWCRAGLCVANPCAAVKCADSEVCVNGVCHKDRCKQLRDPCKQGRICTPEACIDTSCYESNCPDGQICDPLSGQCYGKLSCQWDKDCPTGGICGGSQCFAPSCYAVACAAGMLCRQGACVTDNCANITCPVDQFCSYGGNCRLPCYCQKAQICGANGCEEDLCSGVSCADGQFCRKGVCHAACPDNACRYGRICLLGEGCGDDNCTAVTCPTGFLCREGYCFDPCAESECPPGSVCRLGQCHLPQSEIPQHEIPSPMPDGEQGDAGSSDERSPHETPKDTFQVESGMSDSPLPQDSVTLGGCGCFAADNDDPSLALWLAILLSILILGGFWCRRFINNNHPN